MRPAIIHHKQKLRINCTIDIISKMPITECKYQIYELIICIPFFHEIINLNTCCSAVYLTMVGHRILTAHQSQEQTSNDSFVTKSYIMYHSQFFLVQENMLAEQHFAH
jgi:hypothetical protein